MQLARSLREWLSPEAVLLILHELDKADQEPEWMRSLDDDSFEENTTDSVGDAVGLLGTGSDDEQVEHERDVEVGVSRGVSKLVSYNGKEVVLACTVSCRITSETEQRTLSIQVERELGKDRYLGRLWVELDNTRLLSDPGNTSRSEVVYCSVQKCSVPRDDGTISRHGLDGDPVPQFRNNLANLGPASSDMLVDGSLDTTCFECFSIVGSDDGVSLHLGQESIQSPVRVRKGTISNREGGKSDIAKLNTVGRNGGTERVVVFVEELGEVVHEDAE